MATRRRRSLTREAQIAFEAITIEGGLLSPEWLAKVAQLQAGAQGEADYRIPKGLNVRDEIGRYWRIAQAHWSELRAGRASNADARLLAERFVLGLLREAFGFASLEPVATVEREGRSYPIGHHALGGRVPLVIAPAGSGLDTLDPAFGDGSRRRSAFGLTQEFLNAANEALWGLASDGVTLRILHDNASLTRPAWIEADLGRIFTEDRYADFVVLWLIAHETRFGNVGEAPSDCALEAWRVAGREAGTRYRTDLRGAVKDALLALGQGFLAHPENRQLRAALETGSLAKDAYFQQLLRLVYRLIFLLTAEERGVLHPDDAHASSAERALYADGYSLRRLRERAVRRSAHDRFCDLWEGLKIVFRGVASGEPRLALPAFGGLFAPHQCRDLDAAVLENRWLLAAFFRLSWLRDGSALARVNWRDMGPEELGSVYESLLELVPQITQDRRSFDFAAGGLTKGNTRKTTGSYYTPDGLVQELLDTALEPVVTKIVAAHPEGAVDALLEVTIVDPACGSGHFLLAAARRLAGHVARLQANGTPSLPEYRHAVRQVVGRCVYGVDAEPLAVELCKVSLWMEAVEPGLPLTFLDSHVRHGNALLGTTPELMAKGIPESAWDPIEGDEKKLASALKKRNKKAAEGQRGLETLWSTEAETETAVVARAVAQLEAISDANAPALARKESQWHSILTSDAYRHQTLVADSWCAAFVWPKHSGQLADAAPTNEVWRQIRDGRGQPAQITVETTQNLAEQYHFFHWHLAFPHVFARGGFDCVLGNPPWEHTELKEKEWFAERSPDIARAQTGAERKRMIESLKLDDPLLHASFTEALRTHEGTSHFLGNSGRFPLCGRGRINLYAVFAEGMRGALAPDGRMGCVLPTGIAVDDTTKLFFQDVVNTQSLASLFDFENKGIFPEVDSRYKFCLFTCGRGLSPTSAGADYVFFAHAVEELRDPERRFTLTPDDIALLNPNTSNCPIFRTQADAALTKAIYRRVPVLVREGQSDGNPWRLTFSQGLFNMAADSHHFRTAAQLEAEGYRQEGNQFISPYDRYLPLYEAKMLHQFDHRWATYASLEDSRDVTSSEKATLHFRAQPRYWVREEIVHSALPRRPELLTLALGQEETSRPAALERAFTYWLDGWSKLNGRDGFSTRWVHPLELNATETTSDALKRYMLDVSAEGFCRRYPLTDADVASLSATEIDLEALARGLVERFSPGWLMGWRDICRSTDERTTISSALPIAGCGDTLLLMFPETQPERRRALLIACLDSFVQDYGARQKVGGTHMKYNVFKQLAVLPPTAYDEVVAWAGAEPIEAWLLPRTLELLFTSEELRPLALACGYEGPPFGWDEDRRFQVRRELDAAFFHLYLPATPTGEWRTVEGETREQQAELRRHFPTPREAVSYVLDTFPIVKRKDEAQHGHYRTKEAVLRIYDALMSAQRSGHAYLSPLSPSPLKVRV